MRFTKMQGLGNDYVYVNCFDEILHEPEKAAKWISDRHFGVGSDGLILIGPSKQADCRMEMYNADGSRGAMCGNGIRCVAKYVYDYGMVKKKTIRIETDAGIKQVFCETCKGKVSQVTVDMGEPKIGATESIRISDREIVFTPVSMGNPHAVIFVEEPDNIDLVRLGKEVEYHERFPDRTNVEVVRIEDRSHMRLRVWERGSGETLACGTGACAAASAAMDAGYTDRQVNVILPGGTLFITLDEATGHLFMTGPAAEVFQGEI